MFFDCVHNQYQGARCKEVLDSIIVFNEMFRELNERMEMDMDAEVSMNEIVVAMLNGNMNKARNMLDSLAPLMPDTEFESNFDILDFYYYSITGDYAMSQKTLARFYENINSSISIDKAVSTAQNLAENNYKEENRKREMEEQRKERIRKYWIIAVIIVLAFIIFEYFRKRRHNKELNEKNVQLMQQKEEILAQSDELFEKDNQLAKSNKQITDSITYASLIQKAALPKDNELNALFNDYFLIYRPLNIVAGDFYWASQNGRWTILVCADCTGHGVPGAFVSMLGISLLNEVTANISADSKASEILDVLRDKLMRALGQNKKKYDNGAVYSMDGMDLAMVMIDYSTMEMQYAGAYRPLWIWRNGEIIQLKPDKMPIGIYVGAAKDFTNHEMSIQKGDVLYMFSDGIPDQFGFTDDSHTTCKHFSTKRLLSMLTEIGGKPFPEQKVCIETAVDEWKNGYKQLDDNILIGIRI